MTSLLAGAKKLVSRSTDLGVRISGLETAVDAGRGRLDDALLDAAAKTADRAGHRMRLSADHTVVAIAGATGSGKSSTFNALTGLEISSVGVRRPTTSWTTACVWGRQGAEELLTWLGIPPRHQVVRDSMLEMGREDNAMQGVVLLDLPDHDSTEVSHHLEVDRLVELADMLVWVLDPQKYADAAIHDRYLAPLASHESVMLVVLNHIDTVPEDRRESMLADVRRLLAADGLHDVPVLAVSAREHLGIEALRTQIVKRVSDKKMAKTRLEADLRAAAREIAVVSGTQPAGKLSKERIASLDDALADSAGVPTVVAAVEKSTRMRAGRATGWPVVAWLSKLKPDPLKRLHLDLGSAGKELTAAARTSVPAPTQVQRARVDTEVRQVAEDVSKDLTKPWSVAIRSASTSRLPDLGDRLDSTLASTDLGAAKIPAWTGIVRVLQWMLILAAIGGALWLGVLAVFGYLQIDTVDSPKAAGLPLPTLLLLGGVAIGVLLALVCRVLVSLTARNRARAADRRLRAAISTVSQDLVVEPIEGELAAYDKVRAGLSEALS